ESPAPPIYRHGENWQGEAGRAHEAAGGEPLSAEAAPETTKPSRAPAGGAESSRPRTLAGQVGWSAALLGVGLVAGFVIWQLVLRVSSKASKPPLNAFPLTSFQGRETQVAFSPDGKQIAFVWDGPQGDNLDIYVKLIGSETPLRLTANPMPDTKPAWSPDGR